MREKANKIYDVVIIGGGIAGASLAKTLVDFGPRNFAVAIVERSRFFYGGG